ncbi:MAG: relaxase/mobilization nuclease domain-containing protein [Alphaproteobacteria bacterium]|nr:relaxase/mobilization nuclease domain-containing protein [Alphaproteobacteria bacterium]
MIFVGSQRAGAKDLALHLMKDENDHVTIHEVKGFVSVDVLSALREAEAHSKGTRCTQYLFSLSLNPPPNEAVETKTFEDAINRAEEKLGLSGQPRVVVFHEKEGRRHAHCVWSRIDLEEMKAVRLPFTKRTLLDLSRELYLEQGWRMPDGLAKSGARDPVNFSLAEWQQAKRARSDPKTIKLTFREAWALCDDRASLIQALKERGFILAQGDRRGFVAIDRQGEIYALARWSGLKTKEVSARLGDPKGLPTVKEAQARNAQEMTPALKRLQEELEVRRQKAKDAADQQRFVLVKRQKAERQALERKQDIRQRAEAKDRQSRFRTGLAGLWDRLRGEHARIRERNALDAYQGLVRDREERDGLILSHLDQRKTLKDRQDKDMQRFERLERTLKQEAGRHAAHTRERPPSEERDGPTLKPDPHSADAHLER